VRVCVRVCARCVRVCARAACVRVCVCVCARCMHVCVLALRACVCVCVCVCVEEGGGALLTMLLVPLFVPTDEAGFEG